LRTLPSPTAIHSRCPDRLRNYWQNAIRLTIELTAFIDIISLKISLFLAFIFVNYLLTRAEAVEEANHHWHWGQQNHAALTFFSMARKIFIMHKMLISFFDIL
jgi:hypothetical protein